MNNRTLGGDDLAVSAVGVGCMTISTKPEDRSDAVAVLRGAVERGATFFYTAEAYGPSPTKSSSARHSPRSATRW